MGLSEFITVNSVAILAECEAFARTLPAGVDMDGPSLRDHAAQVLAAIAEDMTRPQSRWQQHEKSQGHAPHDDTQAPTAAEIHGEMRATAGFDINQTTAEYRALRASVIRLWLESEPQFGKAQVHELVRFNEAMDQALAESILYFAGEAAHMRNMFLGVLSHELRTPLSTIVSSAQSLVLAANAQKTLPEAAARILRGGKRIASLLDALLDYVRSGLGQGMLLDPTRVDLSELCSKVIGELKASHPSRPIDFTASGNGVCICDEERIAQAVSNLVNNALKYGAADTAVRIAVAGEDEGSVVISVQNGGPPIPPGARQTLFEPLVRGAETDMTRMNLGLGLYIVREIALAHGGTATVESDETAGTVFKINLPRHAGAAQASAFQALHMS
jgi:signal transduction histidine kinase